jgi:hypothetical protein
VQVFAVYEGTSAGIASISGGCRDAFEEDVIETTAPLDWFAVTIDRLNRVEKLICFVGHADEETLVRGSALKSDF